MDATPALRMGIDPGSMRASVRPHAATRADAERVGREFESMFLSQMLGQMMAEMPSGGAFGGGFGEEMFRSLQTEYWAQGFAQRGGIGIAQAIARDILRMQEARP